MLLLLDSWDRNLRTTKNRMCKLCNITIYKWKRWHQWLEYECPKNQDQTKLFCLSLAKNLNVIGTVVCQAKRHLGVPILSIRHSQKRMRNCNFKTNWWETGYRQSDGVLANESVCSVSLTLQCLHDTAWSWCASLPCHIRPRLPIFHLRSSIRRGKGLSCFLKQKGDWLQPWLPIEEIWV